MKTHKPKTLPITFHKMKKSIHKKLCCFGKFYSKHWKVLVGAKLLLLVIILTFTFSTWSNVGNIISHGAASIHAEGLCGNGTIDLGEECDDNNTSDGDGCSSICLNETPVNTSVCGN